MDKSDWQRIIHIRTHCDDVESFINRFGRDYNTFVERNKSVDTIEELLSKEKNRER